MAVIYITYNIANFMLGLQPLAISNKLYIVTLSFGRGSCSHCLLYKLTKKSK